MTKIIIENDVYIFEHDDMRIEFSEPNLTLFDEENLKDEDIEKIKFKDIMYYGYELTLFTNTNRFDRPQRWEKVISLMVGDFPYLKYLQEGIKNILKLDVEKKGIKQEFGNELEKYLSTQWKYYYNIINEIHTEDEYLITKTKRKVWQIDKFNEPEWYDLYIGCGSSANHNTIGIYLKSLRKKELKQLKFVIDRFIKFGLEDCIKELKEYRQSQIDL